MQTRSGQPDDLLEFGTDDDEQESFFAFFPDVDFLDWYPTFPENPEPFSDPFPPLPVPQFEYKAPYFIAEDPEVGRQSIRVFIPFGALVPVSGSKRAHDIALDNESSEEEIQPIKRTRLEIKLESLDRKKEKIRNEIQEIDEKKLALSQSLLTLFRILRPADQGSTSPSGELSSSLDSFSFS